jgi:hypothetical protein
VVYKIFSDEIISPESSDGRPGPGPGGYEISPDHIVPRAAPQDDVEVHLVSTDVVTVAEGADFSHLQVRVTRGATHARVVSSQVRVAREVHLRDQEVMSVRTLHPVVEVSRAQLSAHLVKSMY